MTRRAPSSGLLVLGMHRSGTSALARVLNLCGADIGARVLGASAGNESGHWEDALAVEVHERLLASFGTRWDETLGLPLDWDQGEAAADARNAVSAYVKGDRSRHKIWAVKDPRMSLFAPIWIDAAEHAGQDIGAILMLRHPLEVARSLAARDGIATGRGLLLWLEYTLAAARTLDHLPCAIVTYDMLLEDWRACVERFRALPGCKGLKASVENARKIDGFLDESRRHHVEADTAKLPKVVAEVWKTLVDWARSGTQPKGSGQKLAARLAPVRELLHPVLDETRVIHRQLWERIARSESAIDHAGPSAPLPQELAVLRESVNRQHADVIEALTGDLARMQQATAEALQASAALEGQAEVARLLGPRLQAVEERLKPLLDQVPVVLGGLAETIELNRSTLVDAISVELKRMQSVTAEALQAFAGREREAELARQIEPRLHAIESGLAPLAENLPAELKALAEGVELNRSTLVDAISVELKRMQSVTAEALQAFAGREREAELARQIEPRLHAIESGLAPLAENFPAELRALAEGVELNRVSLVEAISDELQRMQSVAADAVRTAAVLEREAGLVQQVEPRLQAIEAGLAPIAESLPAEMKALAERVEFNRASLTKLDEGIESMAAAVTATLHEREASLSQQIMPRLRALESSLTPLAGLIAHQHTELAAALQVELRKAREAELEATHRLATVAGEADALRAMVPRLEEAVAVRARVEKALSEVQVALAGKERELSETCAQLGAEATRANAAEERLALLHGDHHESQREIARLQRETHLLQEKERQFEIVKASRSWRWTRPFRVLLRFATGRSTASDHRKMRGIIAGTIARSPMGGEVRSGLLRATVPTGAGSPSDLASGDQSSAFDIAPQRGGVPDVFVWAVIDWHFRHQRPQHLARALAEKGHRVFYISNNFVDAAEPGFRIDPLGENGRLFQIHLHQLHAPAIYFGMPEEEQVERLRASLAELLAWTCTQGSVSLVQHPYWKDLLRSVPNARVVYDCMDHHAGFENNASPVLDAENGIIADADLVIVTSSWLEQELGPRTRALALIRNASEFERFRDPPGEVFRDPEGRQVIGYYGAIAEWFDVPLVRRVAEAYPDALVLMIGSDTIGAREALADLSNVEFTGEVPYTQLPFWLHGIDVCLLPFKVIPLTLATNPVKVYEYLSAGKAVVAVDLPEMSQFGDLVEVASDHADFTAAVGRMLESGARPEDVAARQAFAAEQTWAHRAAALDLELGRLPEPRVSVIVLTYNNLAFTEACLFSVEAYSDYRNLEVLVVDNASTDGSREWLQAWAAEDSPAGHTRRLILNDENLGFSGGNNIGLRAASGDFLVILNNDTYVTPGWVRTLCAHLRQDPTLGLVGPTTNNIGNEAKLDINYGDMAGMIHEAGLHTRANPGRRIRMRNAAFFCVAMRRDVYEIVGAMDEEFGVGFFEDDDYCRRVEQGGFGIACADDVFIHHHLSASFDVMGAENKKLLFDRNKAIYEAKWGEWQPHAYRSSDGETPN